jgi:Arc/MetJ family transcription regulator
MEKHTTIRLDTELVASAGVLLGTTTAADAVHAALRAAVRHGHLRRLAQRELADLTEETLADLRTPRHRAR